VNSLQFLQQFHPTGFWVLTAIKVDRKGIETITFTPEETDQAEAWINKRNGKQNLYFSVNQPNRKLDKKASSQEITQVGWLHVDIDARAGEPLDAELLRIQDLLENKCPVQPPTVVVYSGGGYQAFWKLSQPATENLGQLVQYNKQLELLLGGDNCHNIDRIMRLPGTLNIPDAKKIAKGRIPTEAKVLWFESERQYELTIFTPAPEVQTPGVRSDTPQPTANVARLVTVDDLDKWGVPDRVKVIIVQGHHPDEPKEGDNSRSAWVFDVACQLVRCEVPDDVIFSVMTDPDFGISRHTLEQKGDIGQYTMRQIQRAKEEVEEPWLRVLNEKFMVIGNMGGRCRVCEEAFDTAQNRNFLTRQTFQDFRNRFCNQNVTQGKKQVPLGLWWINHPRRRTFEYLTFSPGESTPGVYNLWQGYGCKAVVGEKHNSFLRHMYENICGGDHGHFEYLVRWMARCVQQPAKSGETAIVLRGASGVGKSFFAKCFGALWGRHFLQVSDAKHLVGSFNAHLRDCVVLFGDEAFFAGDRRHESVLKTLITEERMMIEHKGVDAEVTPNFIHLILASNSQWVVPTGPTERRFFVLDVSDHHQQDGRYFQVIRNDLESGGYENMLDYLLRLDLTGFDVRDVPQTKALREQKIHSMDPMSEWWLERLSNGTLLATQDSWECEVICTDLVNDYIDSCIRFNVQRRGSSVKLGLFLDSVCPGDYPIRHRAMRKKSRHYMYTFPSLEQCRRKWDRICGGTSTWSVEPIQEELPLCEDTQS